jgi:hypothetical protein
MAMEHSPRNLDRQVRETRPKLLGNKSVSSRQSLEKPGNDQADLSAKLGEPAVDTLVGFAGTIEATPLILSLKLRGSVHARRGDLGRVRNNLLGQ